MSAVLSTDAMRAPESLCKAAFRALHAQDMGIGIARAIRAAATGRPGAVYPDLPAKLLAQAMDAKAGKQSLVKVVDTAPRQIPAPEAIRRAPDVLRGAKKPLIILGQGRSWGNGGNAGGRSDTDEFSQCAERDPQRRRHVRTAPTSRCRHLKGDGYRHGFCGGRRCHDRQTRDCNRR